MSGDSLKILILGANGLIGSTFFRYLSKNLNFSVFGSIRSTKASSVAGRRDSNRKIINSEGLQYADTLISVLNQVKPDLVINCCGLTKHQNTENNLLKFYPINAYMPMILAELCELSGARLIQISSDCVYSGGSGSYVEDDIPDARDAYGQSKHMGEIVNSPNAITLRTSTIGHEINTRFGLLEWFLSQNKCLGYSKAFFSGLPTVELARIIEQYVIPSPELHGLYHVGAKPIDKYSLLQIIKNKYNKDIEIVQNFDFAIDRSLNSKKFTDATGYIAPEWPLLIDYMYDDFKKDIGVFNV